VVSGLGWNDCNDKNDGNERKISNNKYTFKEFFVMAHNIYNFYPGVSEVNGTASDTLQSWIKHFVQPSRAPNVMLLFDN